MLESFEVKNENGEEVLYCYISYDYEFSKEFFSSLKETKIGKQVEEWIRKNRISFHGKKVVVLASGIVIATLLLGDIQTPTITDSPSYLSPAITEAITNFSLDNLEQEKINESMEETISQETVGTQTNDKTNSMNQTVSQTNPSHQETVNSNSSASEPTSKESSVVQPTFEQPITIYRNGTPIVLEFEEYVAGVVAAEMPASFSTSALQAQAVLARTYALKYMQEGKRLTDTVDTQVYYDEGQLRAMWGSSYEMYWNKVRNAVQSTKGETLRYQGSYIDAVYHSTSNGKTEAARNVWGYEIPYLQSVDSHWDVNTTFYSKTEYKDLNQLLQLFGVTNLEPGDIEILSYNESGRVSEVRIQGQTYQGVDLRQLLGLPSADFDLSIENGNLMITTRGWGHGVGMSQYGANGMAKEGYTYRQILSHYYPGTILSH